MNRVAIRSLVPAVLTTLLASPAQAQCSKVKFLADDPVLGAWFGLSVAIDGPLAVAGGYQGHGNTNYSGGANAFELVDGAWEFRQRISSPDTVADSGFGVWVAVSGSTIAVGSRGDSTVTDNSGVVFVFDKSGDGWVQTARLRASDPAPLGFFGDTLDIEGERIVVGARPFASPGPAGPGAAYVFERSEGVWSQTAKLVASDAVNDDRFGSRVALSGDRILVGATGATLGGASTGAAYVFDLQGGTWNETAILRANDAADGNGFGHGIALESKRALVGSGDSTQSGAAYLFEEIEGTWSQVRKFTPPPPAGGQSQFGAGVALRGDLAMIGSPRRDAVIDIDRGAVHVYRRTTTGSWLLTDEIQTLFNNHSYLGANIAVSGDHAFISAHGDGPQNRGACYAVRLGGDLVNYGPVVPNSAGAGCTIGWTGSTSLKDNAFTLTAVGMPPHKAGQFAYGSQSTQTPFGNGYRLIGASIFQIAKLVTADASGNATLQLDFTTPPLSSGAGTVLAGVTWYFQLAYLDPAGGGQGFNLSNGLMTTFCP